MNRQINSNFNASKDQKIDLEVLKETKHEGRSIGVGEIVTVTKSEAKRLLTVAKDTFRISIG